MILLVFVHRHGVGDRRVCIFRATVHHFGSSKKHFGLELPFKSCESEGLWLSVSGLDPGVEDYRKLEAVKEKKSGYGSFMNMFRSKS